MKDSRLNIESVLHNAYLRHILFWITYILSMTYIHGLSVEAGNYLPWLLNYLIEFPVIAGLTYLITYYIIPVFLLKKKILFAVLLIISSFLSFSLINVILDEFVIQKFFPDGRTDGKVLNIIRILKNAFGLMFPVVIFVSISFARYNAIKSKNEGIRERGRLQSELEMIRNRMHPVFLRDALDDIYIMSRNPSAAIPEMILKISDILHYLLYDCSENEVQLRKEEQSIRNYLGFEKLRYGDNFNFDILVNGDIENTLISPYILFPLVRASCRFNNDYDETPGKVFIKFNNEGKQLDFSVSQQAHPYVPEKSIDFGWQDEIAIARKRLELIYAWKYNIDIVETDRKLQIDLGIDLS